MWALAVGGFLLALQASAGSVRATNGADLRTPAVLLLDAGLGASLAALFGLRHRTLNGPTGGVWCLAFGLWLAAAFRAMPNVLSEASLFSRQSLDFDPPYVLLGAAVRGMVTFLLVLPYARRVLSADGRLSPDHDERLYELAAAGVVGAFVVAVVACFRAQAP